MGTWLQDLLHSVLEPRTTTTTIQTTSFLEATSTRKEKQNDIAINDNLIQHDDTVANHRSNFAIFRDFFTLLEHFEWIDNGIVCIYYVHVTMVLSILTDAIVILQGKVASFGQEMHHCSKCYVRLKFILLDCVTRE